MKGKIINKNDSPSVYIQQEDILFAQLTVEETLDTSFILEQDGSISGDKKRNAVMNMVSLPLTFSVFNKNDVITIVI